MYKEFVSELNHLAENNKRYDFLSNCINSPEHALDYFQNATKSNYYINAMAALTGAIMLSVGMIGSLSSKPAEIGFFIIPGLFFLVPFSRRFFDRRECLKQLKPIIEKYIS